MGIFEDVFPRPKPKIKNPKVRKKSVLSKATLKKQAALRAEKAAQKKLIRAKKAAVVKGQIASGYRKADRVLNGTTTDSIIVPKELEHLPQEIKEDLAGKDVVFSPNKGPQTAFLAATEREVFFGGARGGGKLLEINTILPTPTGYSTIKKIKIDDYILSPKGYPVKVTWKSEVEYNPTTYKLIFDSKEEILADANHLWLTKTSKDRKNVLAIGSVKTTEEIFKTLKIQHGRETNHSIDITKPLCFTEAVLAIDPYTLGLWLGDGYSHTSYIGMSEEDLKNIAPYIPYELKYSKLDIKNRKTPFQTIYVQTLRKQLINVNLIKNKHIPLCYLRASYIQRIELLRGLMDTDGCANKDGSLEVGFSNKVLTEACLELICSLGIKATITSKIPTIKGKEYPRHYRIKYRTSIPVFKLQRKLKNQKLINFRETTKRRYIVNVERVDPVPMQCIQVENSDGMFLLGKSFIATHNSFAMLVDPLRYCNEKYHSGLLLRRTMPELRDLIEHSKDLYPKAYPNAKWYKQESEWRFPSGARQLFGYAETPADAMRYQGQQYNWIGVDELPQYPSPEIWNKLRGSLRSAHGLPVYMRATGNPGNIGSYWVKEMFIDPAEPNKAFKIEVILPGGRKAYVERRFIPATLYDNPTLTHNDDYLLMLSTLPEIQRKQWLEGDWSAFENRAFPEFSRHTHVVQPFDIPKSWIRFRSCDYGYSAPACVHWFAIDYDNNLYVYRELYQRGLTADVLAQKVLDIEASENIRYGILDASTWAKRGDPGPSIAETMNRLGCKWRPSDRSKGSRASGKVEIHRRLAVDPILDVPRLRVFSHCKNTIQTMEMLPTDPNNPEDADTKAEDHAYDSLRYGCMSRPLYRDQDENFLQRFKESMPSVADATFGY